MARVTPGFAARSHEAPADDQRDAERDLALEDLDDADDESSEAMVYRSEPFMGFCFLS